MSLAGKTFLILLLMAIFMTTLVYQATRWLLMPRFLDGERHDVSSVLLRAQSALEDEQADLSANTNDYGAWDRTYDYMLHPSLEYIRTEYQDETLRGLAVSSVTILDTHQRMVWTKSFDPARSPALDSGLNKILPAQPWVTHRLDSATSGSGILQLPRQSILVAASPILRSDRKGPSRGLLLMTRNIDSHLIESMQAQLQDGLAIHSASDPIPGPSPDWLKAELQRSTDATAVRPVDNNTIAGYKILPDVNGAPALRVEVTTQRTFLRQGMLSLHYLLAGLCLSAVAFVAVTMLMLRWAVLARVTALNQQIHRLGERRDLDERVYVPGADEIARLGDAINTMLAAIRQGESQFRLIAENIHQVLWVKDEASRKVDRISPVINDKGGVWQETLLDDELLLRSVVPEDRPVVEDMLLRQGLGKQGEAEFRVRGSDANILWVWRRHFPVFDSQGNLRQTVGVSEDVTEYKNAEEALLRSQEDLWNVMLASAGKVPGA